MSEHKHDYKPADEIVLPQAPEKTKGKGPWLGGGAAVALAVALIATEANISASQHSDGLPQTPSTEQIAVTPDPVVEKERQTFEAIEHNDLFLCNIDNVRLGDPIKTRRFNGTEQVASTIQFDVDVDKGPKWNDFPQKPTANGGNVEVTWSGNGHIVIDSEVKDKNGNVRKIPTGFPMINKGVHSNDEGKRTEIFDFNPNLKGERTLRLVHQADIELQSFDPTDPDNIDLPRRTLKQDCGKVVVQMHDGKAKIKEVVLVKNSQKTEKED